MAKKKKEIGVVGLGKFGAALAGTLHEQGHSVVALDSSEAKVRRARQDLPHVFEADGTDKDALEQLGFRDMDAAVVSIGRSMEASILVAMNLQELGLKDIWVKAVSVQHRKVLLRLGVPNVVLPEQEVAQRIAYRLIMPGLLDYLGLGEDVVTREVEVDDWHGKSLRELDLTNEFAVQVVAIKRAGDKDYSFVPKANDTLNRGDVLVLLGHAGDVRELVG